jgi:hypothetical protein
VESVTNTRTGNPHKLCRPYDGARSSEPFWNPRKPILDAIKRDALPPPANLRGIQRTAVVEINQEPCKKPGTVLGLEPLHRLLDQDRVRLFELRRPRHKANRCSMRRD